MFGAAHVCGWCLRSRAQLDCDQIDAAKSECDAVGGYQGRSHGQLWGIGRCWEGDMEAAMASTGTVNSKGGQSKGDEQCALATQLLWDV
jgi:hypothetical protein